MEREIKYPKEAGIYKLTCVNNGKIYIGKAINIAERMSKHKFYGKQEKRRSFFENAIHIYGWHSFNIDILEVFKDFDKNNEDHNTELLNKEAYYIKLFNSTDRNVGYNICSYSNDNTGYTWTEEKKEMVRIANLNKPKRVLGPCSEERKEKIRRAKLGKKRVPLSEEHKKKISLSNIGRTVSEETRQKMRQRRASEETREKLRNKRHSEESKEKMRIAALGKKSSEETRQKMRQAKLGKKRGQLSEEHKKKIGLSKVGKPRSEETKEKIRTAHIGNTYSLGHRHTDETKEKMRQAKLGKKHPPISEKQKQQISEANKGRKHTPEAIEKMREAARMRNKRKNQNELQELCI